jgi:hypothetical protein
MSPAKAALRGARRPARIAIANAVNVGKGLFRLFGPDIG